MASPALPWIGAGLVGFAVTGALGYAGVFGRPDAESAALPAVVVDQRVSYRDCPDGAVVGAFAGRDRVLAVAHDGAGWVAVRNPSDVGDIVWMPASVLIPDDGQAPFDGLPVATCATVDAIALPPDATVPESTTSSTVPETTTTSTTVPATTVPGTQPPATQPPATQPPATQPPATQPPANVPPVIGNLTASPNNISPAAGCAVPTSSTITVGVTDASGVGSVQVRWRYRLTGNVLSPVQILNLTKGTGNNWTGVLNAPPEAGLDFNPHFVQMEVVAYDPQQLEGKKNFNSSLTVEFCLG